MEIRIGIGYDSHRFIKGRPLYIGGVEIPYDLGLLGHSDGDVLIHAIIDAILGALGDGDIGKMFPNSDPKFKGIRSTELLKEVKIVLNKHNAKIVNIDSVVVLEEPKIASYTQSMCQCISSILDIDKERVSVKGKTNEAMGFVGRKEGIAAIATVLLQIE